MAGTLELSLERRPPEFYPPPYISPTQKGPAARRPNRQTGRRADSGRARQAHRASDDLALVLQGQTQKK